MGTGASSAKRKAKKAAAAQYYKEFAKLKESPELERVATSNKRDIEESIGDAASFRTRNLSQKADRVGRELNKDEDYRKATKAYNDRYSILKDQIANKSTTRYVIDDTPAELPEKNTSFGGLPGVDRTANGTGLIGFAGANFKNEKPQSSFANNKSMYATKEEAIADAEKKMQEHNESIKSLVGKRKPINQNGLIGSFLNQGEYTQRDIEAMRVNDPSRFIKEERFDGFGALYRNLDKAESAANDINALGTKMMNSKGAKNIEAYSALADKLKPMIKRDARNAQDKGKDGQSLVSNELASATPYLESL